MPSGGSIQPTSAARFASSAADWPVAQWSASAAVMGSSWAEGATSPRSAKYVSQRPRSGTAAGTACSPSVRLNRVERPRSRRKAAVGRLGTSSWGASG